MAATLHVLGVRDIDFRLPENHLKHAEEVRKKAFLNELASKVVKQFVAHEYTAGYSQRLEEKDNSIAKYKCQHPECEKVYTSDVKGKQNHEIIHGTMKAIIVILILYTSVIILAILINQTVIITVIMFKKKLLSRLMVPIIFIVIKAVSIHM